MLPRRLIKGLDKGRLRDFLVLFFLALAVPTGVLIWQAYSQLKWEAFHQHRGVAEELSGRIDSGIGRMIRAADARSYADYTFLVVSGDPSANFLQRSPLSAFPVQQDLPGVLGYFQVDSDGVFSSPLLPPDGTEPASLGIDDEELDQRVELAREIRGILADNRLVMDRRVGGIASLSAAIDPGRGGFADEEDELSNAPAEEIAEAKEDYSQQAFDKLSQVSRERRAYYQAPAAQAVDEDLQKKSELEEAEGELRTLVESMRFDTQARNKRREQIALPERANADTNEVMANVAGSPALRISTFESEVDPYEFSVLDSGHLVLFRKVWREDSRIIQGFLIEKATFIRQAIGQPFMDTALSEMTTLAVGLNDEVIGTFGQQASSGYPDLAEDLGGTLLYGVRLMSPLDALGLTYAIERLPPGPGARVLGWVTLVIAAVFVGGFLVLYRLGQSQIDMARQQQDFVSAVSHELKTPLTSIRMYGEMLREGWADEDKRQDYYEFIHNESERLSRLISNVLQLARITRNEPHFDLKAVPIAGLMTSAETLIASQVASAGFECRIVRNDDADQASVDIDEDCFAQILINLVDNAIKFSRNAEQKLIEIGSRLAGDNGVQIWVRDYGPGIPPDQMKRIFELFYRTESELTRETVGTGIGLAIVHQLTLAMGGRVDMVNKEPGAEFRVWLPLGTREQPADQL